jgi:hypothetical protein
MNNIEQIGWLTFMYSDQTRMGYALGPDLRPGTNNLVVLTPDGTRTFNVSKMTQVVNESELYA